MRCRLYDDIWHLVPTTQQRLIHSAKIAIREAIWMLATGHLEGAAGDGEVLVFGFFIEGDRRLRQFWLAMEGLVGNAQQGGRGNAVTKSIGGDRGGFHVHGDAATGS